VTEFFSKSLFLIIKNLTEIFDEISPEKNSDKTYSTHTHVWASSCLSRPKWYQIVSHSSPTFENHNTHP